MSEVHIQGEAITHAYASSLKDQVVIVTGGGRGIGRAICLALAEQGATVAAVARTLAEIESTQTLILERGGRALAVQADVTDQPAVEAMASRVVEEFGRVDVLINNAGSFYALGPVAAVEPAAWWADVSVNLLGTFLPCHFLLPTMIEAGQGKIITMLGGGTGNPLPYGTGYASSKAAVVRFTDCLAAEVREYGIAVVCMSPGFVRTRLTEYHVFSEAGKRYLPTMQGLLDGDKEYPPDHAAALAADLCRLDLMPLTGRYVQPGDDVEALLAQADEIVSADRRSLRLRP